MGSLLGDFRYAFRSLVRQPTFAAMAILTLVLGIGTNTAIFSVIKAVLLNQLPYEDPSRLVVLWEQNPDGNTDLVAPLTYLDWKEQAQVDANRWRRSVSSATRSPATASRSTSPACARRRTCSRCSASTRWSAGRFFPRKASPAHDRVAVLSRAFWERHFGGAQDVDRADDSTRRPAVHDCRRHAGGIRFPAERQRRCLDAAQLRPQRRARTIAQGAVAQRRRPPRRRRHTGAGAAEMSLVASRLASTFPDSNTGWGARVVAAQEQLVTTVRPALLLISGAVGFLLLIVCANVANLMLARLSSRRGEIAVRAALGAGRVQLVRQVLAESFVLSAVGGALGLFVAWAGVRFVHALPEGSLPRMQDVRLDGGVLLFALLASVLVCAGVRRSCRRCRRRGPACATRSNAFSGATRGTERAAARRARGRRGGARADAARRRRPDDAQLRAADARVARVRAGEPARRADLSAAGEIQERRSTRTRFYMDAIRRVGSLPGVRSAAGVSALPMYPVGIDFALPFTIEGKAAPTNGEEPRADIRTATPGYFETMKIALLKGRLHRRARLARACPARWSSTRRWRGAISAARIRSARSCRTRTARREVVGIVGDVKHYGLDGEPRAELFMPAWQQPLNGMALVVRTASDPKGFIDAIRREMLAIDAEQPIYDASTMVDVVSRSVFLPRISMLLLGAFALTALLLAVVGIYGVVSYSVTQRTRELGVRMALGAAAADTLRLVLGRSMRLVAAGTACGLVASLAVTRVMSGLLYDVSPLDPVVFVGVSLLLAGAGLVASLVPARRATRVDPIEALRIQ